MHCTPKVMPAANIVILYHQRHSERLSERLQKHVIIRLKQIFQTFTRHTRTHVARCEKTSERLERVALINNDTHTIDESESADEFSEKKKNFGLGYILSNW